MIDLGGVHVAVSMVDGIYEMRIENTNTYPVDFVGCLSPERQLELQLLRGGEKKVVKLPGAKPGDKIPVESTCRRPVLPLLEELKAPPELLALAKRQIREGMEDHSCCFGHSAVIVVE